MLPHATGEIKNLFLRSSLSMKYIADMVLRRPGRKRFLFVIAASLFHFAAAAQAVHTSFRESNSDTYRQFTPLPLPIPAKLHQRNYGMILGLQRGASTAIELGGEMHWRKISLRKPVITGASANLEYSFGNHVIGYKAGIWRKQGRVNLTYGANIAYFTDFEGKHKYGGGPAVGFRLAGFHFINGYNFLGGDKDLKEVNTLYVTLRYYFPLHNKFTWDKKTSKRKEREKRKKKKRKNKKEEEKKGLRKLLDFDKED